MFATSIKAHTKSNPEANFVESRILFLLESICYISKSQLLLNLVFHHFKDYLSSN